MSSKQKTKKNQKSALAKPLRTELDLRPATVRGGRRLHLPRYTLWRIKRVKHPERLPSSWVLSKKSVVLLWRHRRLFLSIVLVYGILNLVFVHGLSGGTDVNSLKQQINDAIGVDAGQVVTGVSVFVSLLAASGNSASAAAGAYQLFLGVIVSLATIWALRQVLAGRTIRMRDAFYQGMYPLVPFVLVLVVILLQTLPFLASGGLFSFVVGNGIAISPLEIAIFGLIFIVLTLVSVYWLCSSVFALYVVTLPDMTPLKALRSARQLVHYRRGQIFRRLLYLPVALVIVSAIIMVPVILVAAPAAQWVFFALSTFWLIVAHAYIYILYKELLA